jgi:hypothetical protein
MTAVRTNEIEPRTIVKRIIDLNGDNREEVWKAFVKDLSRHPNRALIEQLMVRAWFDRSYYVLSKPPTTREQREERKREIDEQVKQHVARFEALIEAKADAKATAIVESRLRERSGASSNVGE